MGNIFASVPDDIEEEVFEELLSATHVRIERIISKGHSSPEHGWYDQAEGEWIIVLEGSALLLFEEGGAEVALNSGDYLNIPAHAKHKVSWTDPNKTTVWLAIFYS